MPDVPLVLFAFNRPAKLRRVVRSLAGQGIEEVIIFVDGPRDKADKELVEECIAIGRGIHWAEVKLYTSPSNRGLNSLLENIDLVFEEYQRAIFLEDDCLPMPGFYDFMQQALANYQAKEEVFSVSGYQYLPQNYFRDYGHDTVSTARFTCWGWGTWQDRWVQNRTLIAETAQLFDSPDKIPTIAGSDFPQLIRARGPGEGPISWDIKVALAALKLRKVHILPTAGLIRNIGQDRSGVHQGIQKAVRSKFFHNRNVTSYVPGTPLRWQDDVTLDCGYAYDLMKFIRSVRSFRWREYYKRGKVLGRRYIYPRRERLDNLNLSDRNGTELQKRALLSYIVHPFFIEREEERFFRHINIWHAQVMVKVLNELGYWVDVIDYRDVDFLPQKEYDLFIGHGGVNYSQIAARLPPETIKLYFSTGSYWQYHNQMEMERFEALRERRGVELPPDRYIHAAEEQALRHADAVIGIGNETTRKTYQIQEPVHLIHGASLYDDHFEWCPKDYLEGRNHFLFYAGGGNVHKGLDLLLEVFSDLPQHLWICSPIGSDFERLYARELHECHNIHLLGWTQPRSAGFYKVMTRCNFAILPSCSEGQSQSVVECMNQGLIPVVSKAAGVDVDTCGVVIDPISITRISEIVQQLSGWPLAQCQDYSLRARQQALSNYSEGRFEQNLKSALVALIEKTS